MSALLDEETTTVVLDELDFEVTCPFPGCGKAATHMVTCRACGHGGGICAEHLAFERRAFLIASIVNPHDGRKCAGCRMSGSTFDDVFEVVPL